MAPRSSGEVTAASLILVRARITPDEWAALRKVAIDRNEAVADTVAAALRKAYPTITERQAK